jgi:hypothetical protein
MLTTNDAHELREITDWLDILDLHKLGQHLHRILDGDHMCRLEEVELLLAAEVFVDAASQVLRSV